MDNDQKDDPEAALELIKAIHRTGGKPMTDDEIIEFLKTPRTVFVPDRLMQKRRGPKSRLTPIQQAHAEHADRWRGLYHRLVRGPDSRASAAKIRRMVGDISREQVGAAAALAIHNGIPQHKLTTYVSVSLRRSDRQVRRILEGLGYVRRR